MFNHVTTVVIQTSKFQKHFLKPSISVKCLDVHQATQIGHNHVGLQIGLAPSWNKNAL